MTEELQKKQFVFKGKTIDELKNLDVREFARFVKARARRTMLRQFQEIEEFVNRAKKKESKNKRVRVHNRRIVIVPQMIGMKIQVYNGKEFVPIDIVGEMLGHRLGEFALTRTRTKHGKAGVGATKGSKHKSKK